MSRRPSQRRHKSDTEHELNLVPIMNLVLMLIPAILITAAFVEMAVINVSAPLLSPDGKATPMKKQLNLTVALTDRGFIIAGAGGVLGPSNPSDDSSPTIPKTADGKYDLRALNQKLSSIKDAFPTETRVILSAEPDIAYDTVIQTMDAARESEDHRELFPDVVLSPGVS